MSFTMTGAITGGAQTGFTTPGYTLGSDNSPDVRSKQSAVTALTGTQAGVVSHTINCPFTVTVRRPSFWKTLSQAFLNGVTGQYSKVPFNETVVVFRKGAAVAANQWWTNEARIAFKIYAGTETYDGPNVRALMSFIVGWFTTNSAGAGQALIDGIQ